jgi:hypothetical protein
VRSAVLEEHLGLSAGALRTSISRLRRVIGPDVLVTGPAGYELRAETDVDDLGRWTGRCVVDGPQFQGTVVLYSPFRAPTAALDALLTAARRSIDEGRNVTRRRGTR